MKRYLPYVAAAAGTIALLLLIPRFNAAQPHGAKLTRAEAHVIADRHARSIGIPVDHSYATMIWVGSGLLDKELSNDSERRRRAAADPVIGPRLGGYKVNYHRKGLDKSIPYGSVYVAPDNGDILGSRLRKRTEEKGANATEQQLLPRADAFVASRSFRGAPSPRFESARPTVQRNRTDWVFRYRAQSRFSTGNVVPYLYVYFIGDTLSGYDLIEEYADGSMYRGDAGGDVGGFFLLLIATYVLELVLLISFLRKYHAGEVGVGTASFLFASMLVLLLITDALMLRGTSENVTMGNLDAPTTALAQCGFKFLFFDIPTSVLVFFAWAVGESYARERWGERLASFDAILRRDFMNATVGRSIVRGILFGPAVAAGTFLVASAGLFAGLTHPSFGRSSYIILGLGGAISALFTSMIDATLLAVVVILFVLAFASRKRLLPLGIIAALALGVVWGAGEPPLEPVMWRMIFGFGGIAVAVAVFLGFDLLTASTAIFFGSLLTMTLPLINVTGGSLFEALFAITFVPMMLILGYGVAALMTKREIAYQYEDFAPHVKRIVERERVKAEIDAANRIQAALLPLEAPQVEGVTVSSHYRAATEIGGDYFDFLPLPSGEIGIAFGDVAGHGLTSGIVMAMAKSALLVQVRTDANPPSVLGVLNDIVMKTAPRRMTMTFFFGVLNPATQTLRFSSAGQLDPYVYRSATRKLEPLSSWGFPLGVRRREGFRELSVDFSVGDRLILYSDGLIEALDDDGEPFGFDRFERTLLDAGHHSADEIKKTLLHAVKKFTANRPPEDDQTLVVISFDERVEARVALEEAEEALAVN